MNRAFALRTAAAALGLSLAALGLSLAAPGCRPPPRSAPIDIDKAEVEVGTGGLVAPDRWSRAVVRARTPKDVFAGDVQIVGLLRDGSRSPETFRKRFEVSTEFQSIEVPFLPHRDWTAVAVIFRGQGIAPETKEYRIAIDENVSLRVMTVRDGEGSAISFLPAGTFGQEEARVGRGALSPRTIPRHFTGYEAADIVVLDGASLADADPERVEALAAWVRRGGVLLAAPGPDWAAKLPDALRDLLGLAHPPRPLDDADRLAALRAEAGLAPGSRDIETFYALDPAPGARLLGSGLAIEGRPGSGRTFLLAFVPKAPGRGRRPAPLPPGALDVLGDVVAGAIDAHRFSRGLRTALEKPAVDALQWYSGFRYPPRSKVLIFVIAYLGVGFFLAAAIFGRKKRLEWMYVFALGVAVIASIGIYRFGLLSAIRALSIDEITVATVRRGTALADATSIIGVSTPDQRTLRPDLTAGAIDGAVPAQPRTSGNEEDPVNLPAPTGFPGGQRAFPGRSPTASPAPVLPLDYVASGDAMTIPDVFLYPNSTRYLRFDHTAELGGKLEAQLVGEGGKKTPVVRISNGTRHDLTFFVCGRGGVWSMVQPVRAGATCDLDLWPETGGGDGSEAGLPDTEEEMQARLWNRMLAIARAGRAGPYRLIARTAGPLFPDKVLGPVRRAIGFLVLELESPR